MKIDIKGVIVPNDDKWVYDWFDMDAVAPREVLTALDRAPTCISIRPAAASLPGRRFTTRCAPTRAACRFM